MVKGDIFYSRLVFSTPDLIDGKEVGPHYWLLIKIRKSKKRDGTGEDVCYFVPFNTKDAFHKFVLGSESSLDHRKKSLITIKRAKNGNFPPLNTVVQSKVIVAIKESDIVSNPKKILYLEEVKLKNDVVAKISQSVNYWMAKKKAESGKYLVDITNYENDNIKALKDVSWSIDKIK